MTLEKEGSHAKAQRPQSEENAVVGTDRRAVRDSQSGRPSLTGDIADGSPNGVRLPHYHVTYLPVDRDGLLKLADLEEALRLARSSSERRRDETAVVSLMWASEMANAEL